MNVMAPTRLSELHQWRIPLNAGPAAAAEARKQIRAAIWAWDVSVDPSDAILLTSELVTNAIRHEPGGTIMISVTCSHGELRVDVHDTSRDLPVVIEAAADSENGRGLMLVATLATEWGYYRTPEGKAVYFTLSGVGMVNRESSSSDSPSPLTTTAVPVARSPRRDRAQG
jgi:anti-sigma regulatory factor (Ser/Thr protein kinase)